MRAACFAPSFLSIRGLLEGGWLQAGSSDFNEKSHFCRKQQSVCEKYASFSILWVFSRKKPLYFAGLLVQSKLPDPRDEISHLASIFFQIWNW